MADRYLLTTAVEMTPHRKDEIIRILGRPGMSPADVMGREDLNNRLEQYPQVHLQHHKLWLTSAHLLAKLAAATAFLDGNLAVEDMRLKLERYVPNPSFDRAMEILKSQRVCVIVGSPGVGKTTLAQALLVAHLQDDFQPVRIVGEIAELKGIADPKMRQIFYYDDFLGPTGLDRTRSQEQSELVRFMEQVEHTPNWRFVLTTRDYILHAARDRSDRLHDYFQDLETCAIRQETYTIPIRAEILYSHLYFSALPDALKLEMVRNRQYMSVVNHRNYNPRIIAFMTNPRHTAKILPGGYAAAFHAALEDPSLIWDSAFREDISAAARHVLLALLTLPDSVPLNDLERSFEALHQARSVRDSVGARPYDFKSALKELAGNFITIEGPAGDPKIRFQNPSVRDYLERHVAEVPREAIDLIAIATTSRQLFRLWAGRAGTIFPGLVRAGEQFVEHAQQVVTREMAEEYAREQAHVLPTPEHRRLAELRVDFALGLAERFPGPASRGLLRQTFRGFIRALSPNGVDPDAALRMSRRVSKLGPGYYRRTLLTRTKALLLGEMLSLEGVKRAAEFAWWFSAEITYADRAVAREKLNEVARDLHFYTSAWESAGQIEVKVDALEEAASRFHVNIEWELKELRELVDERAKSPPPKEEYAGPTLLDMIEKVTAENKDSMATLDASFRSFEQELRNTAEPMGDTPAE